MSTPNLPTIRRAQMQVLARASTDAFYERLASHVARVFPRHRAMVEGERGRTFMESCLLRAAAYGITSGRSVAMFTDLVIGLGQEFDDQPRHAWIREILESGLGDAGKMYVIYRRLPEKCPGPPAPVPEWARETGVVERRSSIGPLPEPDFQRFRWVNGG